jgi:hypothetical protein
MLSVIIKVDGFVPKAVVEKYREDFEKRTKKIGIP